MPPVTMTKVIASAIRPTSVINRPWLRMLAAREEAVGLLGEDEQCDRQENREHSFVAENARSGGAIGMVT